MTTPIPGPGNDDKNVQSIFEEAKTEVLKEIRTNAKEKIKRKLKELNQAERVVANVKREIRELELEISQELS